MAEILKTVRRHNGGPGFRGPALTYGLENWPLPFREVCGFVGGRTSYMKAPTQKQLCPRHRDVAPSRARLALRLSLQQKFARGLRGAYGLRTRAIPTRYLLYGELPAEARRALDSHLRPFPTCTADALARVQLKRASDRLFPLHSEPGISNHVQKKIATKTAAHGGSFGWRCLFSGLLLMS